MPLILIMIMEDERMILIFIMPSQMRVLINWFFADIKMLSGELHYPKMGNDFSQRVTTVTYSCGH